MRHLCTLRYQFCVINITFHEVGILPIMKEYQKEEVVAAGQKRCLNVRTRQGAFRIPIYLGRQHQRNTRCAGIRN